MIRDLSRRGSVQKTLALSLTLIVFIFSSCVWQDNKLVVSGLKSATSASSIEVTAVQINPANNKIIVSGSNLQNVTNLQIQTKEAWTYSFDSQSSTQIVATILHAGSTALNFAMETSYNLLISTAYANVPVVVTFTLPNNSVTTNHIVDDTVSGADLSPMGAATGQFLQFNGTDWAPANISTGLVYKGSWNANTDAPNLAVTNDCGGTVVSGEYYIVATAGATNIDGTAAWAVGDWVVCASSGSYQKIVGASPTLSLDNLTDVTIAAPVINHVLQYSGGAWVNATLSIDKLSDVDTTTSAPVLNQVLKWDGANWTPQNDVTGSGAIISVNTQTGIVTLDTDNINEGVSNQYFTQARARNSISAGNGISYASGTGVISANFGTTATTVAAGNHTHADATLTTSGFMSAIDKTKLDNLATDAIQDVDFAANGYMKRTAAGVYTTVTTIPQSDLGNSCANGEVLKSNGAGAFACAVDATGSGTDATKVPLAGGNMTGALQMNAANEVRFADSDSSNYAAIKSPATISANYVLTLPVDDGTANQVLTTDGAGVLTWTSPSGSVSSVFSRSGAVVATAGDYTATQITNTAAGNIAAITVQAALNELDTEKQAIITTGTAAQYLKGDLSLGTFATDVRGTLLTGYSASNSSILSTDSVLMGFNKAQGQINNKQDLDSTLTSIAAYNTNGILVQTAADTFTGRTLTGTANRLTVTNGDGVSGNPTVNLDTTLLPSPLAGDAGKFYQASGANTGVWMALTASSVTAALTYTPVNKAGDSMSGALQMSATNEIRFADSDSSNYVGFKSPTVVATNKIWTLPIADGSSGQILKTDGSGNLSWVNDNAGGGAFVGTVNRAVTTDGAGALTTSATTDTELGYLSGVTSAVQTQLNAKQTTTLTNGNILIGNGSNVATSVSVSGDATLTNTGVVTIANSAVSAAKIAGQTITDIKMAGIATSCAVGEVLKTTGTGSFTCGTDNATDATKVPLAGGNMTGTLQMNAQNQARYADADSSNYAAIRSPATITTNYVLTLPVDDGTANQVLTTDGAGVLTWTSPAGSVSSVFSRSGAVVATAGDYTAAQITNTAAGNIAAITVQAAIDELDSEKQTLITAGTTAQYYRGDKTFVDFSTDVRGSALTGFSASNATILSTDSVLMGFNKAQGQLNNKQNVDSTITSLAAYNTNGILVQTAADTFTGRTLTGTANRLTVTNGDGVAGNPTVNLDTTLLPSPLAGDAGKFYQASGANTGAWMALSASSVTGALTYTPVNKVGDTMTGALQMNAQTEMRFADSDSSNYGSIRSPATITANYVLTLPVDDGVANQVLTTDGAGILTWTTPASAPVSTVFSRTGAVVAAAGDYTATQITNTAAGNIAAITVQAALNELDTEKQTSITAGTTAQYYRGDKTFVDFATDVRGSALTGFSASNATILSTDSILMGFNKAQGQISAHTTSLSGKADQTNVVQTITALVVTGLSAPLAGSDAANKTYVDATIASSSTASPWIKTGSDIYYNSGLVGIGTTAAPVQALDVKGTIRITPAAAGTGVLLLTGAGTGVSSDYWEGYASSKIVFNAGAAGGFGFGNNNNLWNLMTITGTGNVGIGTSNPSTRLSISAGIEDGITITSASGPRVSYLRASDSLGWSTGYDVINNRFAITQNPSSLIGGSGERFIIDSSGLVGIGTTIPSNTLHVVGSAKISTLASAGTRCVHADTNGVLSITASDCGAGAGTVTSVSGTAPIVVTGTTAPVVSMAAATTSVDGYLTSTDWNTFNNKLTSVLTNTNIFVGNGSNVATGVAMSGDATLANTGAITIASLAVSASKIAGQTITDIKMAGISSSCANGEVLKTTGTGSFTCGTDNATDATKVPLAGGNMTGALQMNAQNNLRFADSDSSNYVAFRAPATVTANILWTLPAIDGSSGQVLSTNGSGTLAWASSGGGASGTGSPEGVLTGSVGDTYRRTDGGAGTTFYVKESGNATNTGWVPMNSRSTVVNTSLVLSGFGTPSNSATINGTYTNMGLMNGYTYWERTNASPDLIRVYYSPGDGFRIHNINDNAIYYRNSVNYTDGGVWEMIHSYADSTVGTVTNGLTNSETDGPLILTGFGTPSYSASINGTYQFMLTSGGYKKWAKNTTLGEVIEIYYNASDGYRIHNITDNAIYYKNNAAYTDTGVWEVVHSYASNPIGSVTGGIAQANAGNGVTLSGFGAPSNSSDINLVYRYMGVLGGYPYYQALTSLGELMTIYYNSTDGYRIENQTDNAIYYKNSVNYVAGSTWTKVHSYASTTIGSVTSVDNGGNLETVTASKTLNAGHDQRTFINTGAGALVTLTLPSANQAGLTYKFINRTGSGMRILAAGSDTIVDTTTSSVGGGYVQTTVTGGVIEIMSVEYNKWIITNSRGAITVN